MLFAGIVIKKRWRSRSHFVGLRNDWDSSWFSHLHFDLELDELRAQLSSELFVVRWSWEDVRLAIELREVFIIVHRDQVFNVIPKRVLGPQQAVELREFLRSTVTRLHIRT